MVITIPANVKHWHGDKGAFITGSDFMCDGGATASYYYGPLNPNVEKNT